MANFLTKWLKLDNSAKIYPMLMSKKTQNLFRLSAELKEDVDKDVLQQALEITIERFPSFKVQLMKGFFWYYFEENNNVPKVVPESDIALEKITFANNNGYNFRVSYFNNRVSIDFFHAICDGSGGLELLKSLLYTYLNLKGYNVLSEKKVLTVNTPVSLDEIEDSFIKYYKPSKFKDLTINQLKGDKCYKVEGILFNNNGKGIVTATCSVAKLLEVCRAKNCTVTQYIGGLFFYSVYMTKLGGKRSDNKMLLFCPINLRKIFPSVTLRNFSLFSRVACDCNEPDLTLDRCIGLMRERLEEDTDKTLLTKKISTTVRAEKLPVMRITPLFIKQGLFNIGSRFFGSNKKTATFSNLGIADLPDSMAPYVDNVTFTLNSSRVVPYNVAVVSYGDKLNISFSRSVTDTEIETYFVRYLTNEVGLDVSVSSNFWEVENAL